MLITLKDLKQQDPSEYLPNDYKHLQQEFQLTVKQLLIGLPVEPILESYPQIKNWIDEMRELLPSLFTLSTDKLHLDTVFSQLISDGETSGCLQIHTNAVHKRKNTILIEWGIRQPTLSWIDRVKLWVACEYLGIAPEKLQLIVLACQPERTTERIITRWDLDKHQETKKWIVEMLTIPTQTTVQTPTLDLENLEDRVGLAEIPEVAI